MISEEAYISCAAFIHFVQVPKHLEGENMTQAKEQIWSNLETQQKLAIGWRVDYFERNP